ncbi:hypothetical protein D3C73_1578890 [compost metagenome]
MPLVHWAMTSLGLDTMNMGALMTGRDIWPYKSVTREWGIASSRCVQVSPEKAFRNWA